MATKQQIKMIHACLAMIGKANDADFKKDLVASFTGGQCSSTTELNEIEAGLLIQSLNKKPIEHKKKEQKNVAKAYIPGDAARKKILHMAHQMGWELPSVSAESGSRKKVDMDRVNAWCVKYGHLHKRLNEYEGADLGILVTNFEKMYLQFLNGIVNND